MNNFAIAHFFQIAKTVINCDMLRFESLQNEGFEQPFCYSIYSEITACLHAVLLPFHRINERNIVVYINFTSQ